MRLPYTEDPPRATDAESAAIVNRVRERRLAAGYKGLVELDRTLLHSPLVADGWNSFLGAVRTKTTLLPSIRELIICRVAALNNAQYEWNHHEPILIRGLVDDQVVPSTNQDAAISGILAIVGNKNAADFSSVNGIDEKWAARAKATIRYIDTMTTDVVVPLDVWKNLKDCWEGDENIERTLVEITATCASYNCVSRFLVALEVGE